MIRDERYILIFLYKSILFIQLYVTKRTSIKAVPWFQSRSTARIDRISEIIAFLVLPNIGFA
jgi:hypothetical protein